MTTVYTNWSLYITFTILDKNNFGKASHHSCTSGGYIRYVYSQCHVGSWHVLSKMSLNTSLTTLCSHFLLSYSNHAMAKFAHWWSWSYDLHG